MAGSSVNGEVSAPEVYLRATALGFVAGLRSMTPLMLLSRMGRLQHNPATQSSSILDRLDSDTGQIVTSLLAAGEILGDKLPFVPSRTSAAPLGGRIAIGMLAGTTLCQQYGQSPVTGAMIGGASALLGTYAGNFLRSQLDKGTVVPDAVWAIAEDALALGLGLFATGKIGQR